jgi:hypothetical protein
MREDSRVLDSFQNEVVVPGMDDMETAQIDDPQANEVLVIQRDLDSGIDGYANVDGWDRDEQLEHLAESGGKRWEKHKRDRHGKWV